MSKVSRCPVFLLIWVIRYFCSILADYQTNRVRVKAGFLKPCYDYEMRNLIYLIFLLGCQPDGLIVIGEDGYPISPNKKECMVEEYRNIDGVMFVICHGESEEVKAGETNSRVDW